MDVCLKESQSLPAAYFQKLSEIEAVHFWYQARRRLILFALKKYFFGARSFLEIGCGTGYNLAQIEKKFPDLAAAGCDWQKEALELAAATVSLSPLFQLDAADLSSREEFDVIGAFDVLEHLADDEKVLHKIHDALKEDGGLILTVPQHEFLWSRHDQAAGHFRRYTARNLKEKVGRAGFKIIRTVSFVSLLWPVLVIQRFTQKQGPYDLVDCLKINPRLNWVANKILELEFRLIKSNLNFRWGGSLMLIARKK